jgi:hypothetical protein
MNRTSDSAPSRATRNATRELRDSRIFGSIAVQPTSDPKIGWLLLTIALASGLALMIPAMTAGPLVLDEYGTYWLAGDGPLTMWERSLNYENIPPLSPWLHRLFMDVFGESEWSFRLPNVLWFLLAIVFSYLFGCELRGPLHGGLCALLVAWHPTALGEIQLARCYSLTLLLSAICFWAAAKWLKMPQSFRWAIPWTLSCVALVWTHYLNIAVVGAVALIVGWRLAIRSVLFFIVLIASLLVICAGVSPLANSFLRMSIWGEHFGFHGEPSLRETVSPMWWVGLPLGYVAGKLFEYFRPSIRTADPSNTSRFGLAMLLIWGLAPTIGAISISHGELASLSNPRYRIGFDVAAGCLLVTLVTWRLGMRASVVAVVISIAASWSAADRLPWITKRLGTRQASQWKDMALHIQRYGNEAEPVFVQSGLGESYLIPALYEDRVFLDYAACRMGRFYLKSNHAQYGLPFRWDINEEVLRFYESLLVEHQNTRHKSLWLASASDTDLNISSYTFFDNMVCQNGYEIVETKQWQDAVLIHYKAIGNK